MDIRRFVYFISVGYPDFAYTSKFSKHKQKCFVAKPYEYETAGERFDAAASETKLGQADSSSIYRWDVRERSSSQGRNIDW